MGGAVKLPDLDLHGNWSVRPRILDLFCGAGGAARGYRRAGFAVDGVDIIEQPNYPFDFFCSDAIEFLDFMMESEQINDYAAIHASPPCQHYANVTRWRGDQADHPDLLVPVIDKLKTTGLPWVVENVPGAPMAPDFVLCGSMFGLPIRRHRWFLTSWAGFDLTPSCQHSKHDLSFDHGGKQPESVYRDAMGCKGMTVKESRNAIPPVYTQFIGRQLLAQIEERAA